MLSSIRGVEGRIAGCSSEVSRERGAAGRAGANRCSRSMPLSSNAQAITSSTLSDAPWMFPRSRRVQWSLLTCQLSDLVAGDGAVPEGRLAAAHRSNVPVWQIRRKSDTRWPGSPELATVSRNLQACALRHMSAVQE